MRPAAFFIAIALVLFQTDGRAQSGLRATVYASGFTLPLDIVQDPSNRSVQLVVEQGGRIRTVRGGTVLPTDFLDLRAATAAGGERGVLGLAFAPDYITSGRFYVNFTNRDGHTVVARFLRSADPLVAVASSRFDLKFTPQGYIEQPYANHNGGNLMFGPDGYLYIGLGDGGSGGDPQHRAQNPRTFLGKMLRIDVNVPDSDPIGYRIPPNNPFLSGGPASTLPEIWAFGLRNPWRYTFDDPTLGGTGALLIGDVGQNAYEEVNYEPRGRGGRNYGWRDREGLHEYDASIPPAFLPLTDPIQEYNHLGRGGSITGGYVYRGRKLGTAFAGRYFFGDFVTAQIWSIALTIDGNGEARASGLTEHTQDLGGGITISSFGVDAAGELFALDYGNGTLLRLSGPPIAPTPPTGPRIIR